MASSLRNHTPRTPPRASNAARAVRTLCLERAGFAFFAGVPKQVPLKTNRPGQDGISDRGRPRPPFRRGSRTGWRVERVGRACTHLLVADCRAHQRVDLASYFEHQVTVILRYSPWALTEFEGKHSCMPQPSHLWPLSSTAGEKEIEGESTGSRSQG